MDKQSSIYPFKTRSEYYSARAELSERGGNIFNSKKKADEALHELQLRDYNIISAEETAILHAAVLLQNGVSISSTNDRQEKVFVKMQNGNNSEVFPSVSEDEKSRIMEEARRRRSLIINVDLLD